MDRSRATRPEASEGAPSIWEDYGFRLLGPQGDFVHRSSPTWSNDQWRIILRAFGSVELRIESEPLRTSEEKSTLPSRQCVAAYLEACYKRKLAQLGYRIVPQLPYSQDLAPSDYYLFTNFKKHLAEQRFTSDDEVIAATEAYFQGLPEDRFSKGIAMIEKRWMTCIELKGDYTE